MNSNVLIKTYFPLICLQTLFFFPRKGQLRQYYLRKFENKLQYACMHESKNMQNQKDHLKNSKQDSKKGEVHYTDYEYFQIFNRKRQDLIFKVRLDCGSRSLLKLCLPLSKVSEVIIKVINCVMHVTLFPWPDTSFVALAAVLDCWTSRPRINYK